MRFKVEFKRTISSILAVAMTFSITSVMPAVAEEAAKYPYAVFAADEAAQRTFRTADSCGKLGLRNLPFLQQIPNAVTDSRGEKYRFVAHEHIASDSSKNPAPSRYCKFSIAHTLAKI